MTRHRMTRRADSPVRATGPWRQTLLALHDLRRTWPQLALTDILAKSAAFVLLTPMLALLLRVFVGAGEDGVLTDEEILFFFVTPTGLILLVVAGAVWAGVLFAEQAGLMTIAFGALEDRRVTYVTALRYASRHVLSLAGLAGRMLARVLLISVPFVAAAGFTFLRWLSEYDINYYLTHKPPEFWRAAAGIGGILLVWLIVLVPMLANWFLAMPAVLFGGASPGDALGQSREASRGRRVRILTWVGAWALTAAVVTGLLSLVVGATCRAVISTNSRTLGLIAAGVALALVIQLLGSVAVSLVAGSLFALLMVRLYQAYLGPGRLDDSSIAAAGSLGATARFEVPRKSLLWVALLIVAVIAGLAVVVIQSVPAADEVAVAAHRGASAAAPENTMAAVELAISEGADWVEIDVQESADGVVVVAHDKDFMKLSGDPRRVWSTRLEDLRTIDVGSWFDPGFGDQRVPTLEQVLLACKGKVDVIIELKYYGHDLELERRVVEIVEATGMVDHVKIMSLSYKGLMKAKALRPDWTYGLLVAVSMGNLARLDVDFLAVNARLARRGLIRSAHGRGMQVFVWTVNDPVQMSAMMSRGVDVVITDEPALARSVLAQREEMTPVERLIVAIGARFGLLEGADESSDASDA